MHRKLKIIQAEVKVVSQSQAIPVQKAKIVPTRALSLEPNSNVQINPQLNYEDTLAEKFATEALNQLDQKADLEEVHCLIEESLNITANQSTAYAARSKLFGKLLRSVRDLFPLENFDKLLDQKNIQESDKVKMKAFSAKLIALSELPENPLDKFLLSTDFHTFKRFIQSFSEVKCDESKVENHPKLDELHKKFNTVCKQLPIKMLSDSKLATQKLPKQVNYSHYRELARDDDNDYNLVIKLLEEENIVAAVNCLNRFILNMPENYDAIVLFHRAKEKFYELKQQLIAAENELAEIEKASDKPDSKEVGSTQSVQQTLYVQRQAAIPKLKELIEKLRQQIGNQDIDDLIMPNDAYKDFVAMYRRYKTYLTPYPLVAKMDPDQVGIKNLFQGYQCLLRKQVKQAMDYFKLSKKNLKNDPLLHILLGNCYRFSGQHDVAIEFYSKGISYTCMANEQCYTFYYLRATAHRENGQAAMAFADMLCLSKYAFKYSNIFYWQCQESDKEIQKRDEKSQDEISLISLSKRHLQKAQDYFAKRQFNDALEEGINAIIKYKNNKKAYLFCIDCYLKLKEFHSADRFVANAMKIAVATDDNELKYMLLCRRAGIYLAANRPDLAALCLSSADQIKNQYILFSKFMHPEFLKYISEFHKLKKPAQGKASVSVEPAENKKELSGSTDKPRKKSSAEKAREKKKLQKKRDNEKIKSGAKKSHVASQLQRGHTQHQAIAVESNEDENENENNSDAETAADYQVIEQPTEAVGAQRKKKKQRNKQKAKLAAKAKAAAKQKQIIEENEESEESASEQGEQLPSVTNGTNKEKKQTIFEKPSAPEKRPAVPEVKSVQDVKQHAGPAAATTITLPQPLPQQAATPPKEYAAVAEALRGFNLQPFIISVTLLEVLNTFNFSNEKISILIRGGMVRDTLLGIPFNDVDISIPFSGALIEKIFYLPRNGYFHGAYDAANTSVSCYYYEKGFDLDIKPNCDINPDNWSNHFDFTINALTVNPWTGVLTDWSGVGLKHLQDRIIDSCIDPNVSLKRSPIQILRAIYFETELSCKTKSPWKITERLQTAIELNRQLLHTEPPSQINYYLCELLFGGCGVVNYEKLKKYGILTELFKLDLVISQQFIHGNIWIENIFRSIDQKGGADEANSVKMLRSLYIRIIICALNPANAAKKCDIEFQVKCLELARANAFFREIFKLETAESYRDNSEFFIQMLKREFNVLQAENILSPVATGAPDAKQGVASVNTLFANKELATMSPLSTPAAAPVLTSR